MSVDAAPLKKPRPSRKSKGAWRKNIDLTAISKGLESARNENLITGNKGLLVDQPSSFLFQTDVSGDVGVQKQTRRQFGTLKADEILSQRSAVPAISTKKRAGSETKVSDGLVPEKRQKRNGVSRKEYQRLRQVAYSGDQTPKDIVPASDSADYDPWQAVEIVAPAQNQDFLESSKPVKAPHTLKRAPISLRADGKKQASVIKPHAGRSYNPEFEDWSQLLSQEGDKEVDLEKRRQREAEMEVERLERVAKASQEAEKENEENSTEAGESEWEGIQSDLDEAQLQTKRPRRKTQVERNKIKRRKEAERLVKHQAKMKLRDEQAKIIQQIKAEVDARDATQEQNKQLLEETTDAVDDDEIDTRLRRRRFGKHAVPDKQLELVLPDELQDSLRKLKPEGNLLNDRFRTMIVQGKIEARRPSVPKKTKTTVTEKWTHKDWEIK